MSRITLETGCFFDIFQSGLCPLFLLSFYRAASAEKSRRDFPQGLCSAGTGRCFVATDRVINTVEQFARPVLDDMGLELVEIQFKQESGWVLRLFIDREGGINVDDCASVSRQVSTFLEVEEVIRHAYTLEVSSPGLERPLKRVEDYIRFTGRRVRIKLRDPLNDQYIFLGILASVDNAQDKIVLAQDQDESDGEHITIDLKTVLRARLSL